MRTAEVKYKKTDIEWLPEVPQHWTLKRGNWVFDLGKEIVTIEQLQSVKSLLHYSIPSIQETGKPTLENGNTIDSNKQIVRPYDLLVSKLNPRKKTIVIVEKEEDGRLLVASTEFVNLKCKDVNTRFAFYLYQSHLVTERITSTVQSSTNSHQRAYPDTIYKMWNYFPPIEEQNAIVDYLDTQSAKINRFIQTKQRFIELLKEQRQSIITNAVTKGIDDAVKMKETVLGEIPEHWEVGRLKNYSTIKGRIGFRGYTTADLVDNGAVVIGATHIKNGLVDLTNPTFLRWDKYYESPEIMVSKGDILVVQRGSCGVIGYVQEDFGKVTINPSVVLVKEIKINAEFLNYFLQSNLVADEIKISVSHTAVPMISQFQIGNFRVLNPPLEEQKRIVEHIKIETRTLDIAINKAEREIELIKEYREAMIAEAVTGKLQIN